MASVDNDRVVTVDAYEKIANSNCLPFNRHSSKAELIPALE